MARRSIEDGSADCVTYGSSAEIDLSFQLVCSNTTGYVRYWYHCGMSASVSGRSVTSSCSESGRAVYCTFQLRRGGLHKHQHERNVGAPDVQAHLSQQRRHLAAMVGLMVEHVREQDPLGDGAGLAVDPARVRQRLREP